MWDVLHHNPIWKREEDPNTNSIKNIIADADVQTQNLFIYAH